MTITQTITLRWDHMPSQNHMHVWAYRHGPLGNAEQCNVRDCQAISITHNSLNHIRSSIPDIKERLRDRLYGPPIYVDAPSDICSICGGMAPCIQHSKTQAEMMDDSLVEGVSSIPGRY